MLKRLAVLPIHPQQSASTVDILGYLVPARPRLRARSRCELSSKLTKEGAHDVQYEAARDAYTRVLDHQPDHAKVLQQLGWLHHQPGAPFADQDKAVAYLTKSLETGEQFFPFD